MATTNEKTINLFLNVAVTSDVLCAGVCSLAIYFNYAPQHPVGLLTHYLLPVLFFSHFFKWCLPLVGVETNPGPALAATAAFSAFVYLSCAATHPMNLLAHWPFVVLLTNYINLLVVCCRGKPFWYAPCTLLSVHFAFCVLRLVGIETNPGPMRRSVTDSNLVVNSFLISDFGDDSIVEYGPIRPNTPIYGDMLWRGDLPAEEVAVNYSLPSLYECNENPAFTIGVDCASLDVRTEDEICCFAQQYMLCAMSDGLLGADTKSIINGLRYVNPRGVAFQFLRQCRDNSCDEIHYVNFKVWANNLIFMFDAIQKRPVLSSSVRTQPGKLVWEFFRCLQDILVFQEPLHQVAFLEWMIDLKYGVVESHPPEFLVGIETNPGPAVLSVPKSFLSDVHAQMQLPVTIGLDGDSMSAIQEILDRLDKLTADGVRVNHQIDKKILDAANPLRALLGGVDPKAAAYKVTLAILCSILGSYLAYKVGSSLARMAVRAICTAKGDETISKVVEPFCEVKAQMGSGDVVTGLLSYLYFQIARESAQEGDLALFMKGCERLGKQKEGLVSFIDHLLVVLQKFSDFVCAKWNIPMFQFRSTGDSNIDDLQKEIDALMTELRKTGLYNAANGKIAFELESRIRKLKANTPKSREFAPQVRAIYDLELAIKPLIQRFERNNIVGNGPRAEPLGIMLGGPSGVGKSTATVPILLALMARVLPKEKLNSFMENHNDFIWNFIPENHFHDAFHGQFCTIIDEAGFVKDSAGMPDPGAMGAIRFINTACMPLTMAHLEDKGNTNFNSEIVFATTNRNFFKWESMYNSEAYVRRFKTAVLAVPKEKYCKESTLGGDPWLRRLDESKLPKEVFCEDLPEYIPWDYLGGHQAPGPILDFQGLVDKLVQQYAVVKEKGEKLLEAHKALKSKYVNERLNAQMDFEGFDRALSVFENIDFPNFSLGNPMLMFSACVSVAAGAWYFLRASLGDQSGDVKNQKTQKVRVKRIFKARALPKNVAQLGANSNVVAGARKVLKRCVYKVFPEGFEKAAVYATFIKGRVAMFPAHFFHAVQSMIDAGELEANPKIVFIKCSVQGVGFDAFFEDLDVVDMRDDQKEENDIFFCVVPKVVPSHPDITSYFKLEKREVTSSRFPAMLAKVDGFDMIAMCTQAYPAGCVNYAPFDISKSYKYDLPTRKGDCGALLFHTGVGVGKAVIVGIHVAGNEKNLGFSTPVDYDMIVAAASLDDSPFYRLDDTPDAEAQMGDKFLVCEEAKKMPLPSSNSVIKSPLFGKFNEPQCAPSMLRPMDLGEGLKDPWAVARSNYSRFQKAMDMSLLDVTSCMVSQQVLFSKQASDPWDPRLYSFEEACEGVPGVAFFDAIPRNKSAGYPFNTDNVKKGKADWFGSEGPFEFDSMKCMELKSSIRESIKLLESGQRMKVIYADYLKDERRPIAKVKAGKSRLISASPMDYLILCRMYFGDFVRSCMGGRITNNMAVGVNPYGPEWGYLVNHLTSVGDKCIFGDYSAYDSSLPVAVMYKVLEIIEDFYASSCSYRHRDSVVRAALFEEVVNSRHLNACGDTAYVYEWFGSNPSGNFLTTLVNSTSNSIMITYCCIKIVCEQGLYKGYLNAASDFSDNVKMINFGDDMGAVVSDNWAPYINQITLTEALAEFGMKYTDEMKSESNTLVHRKLEECTFLKRGFKYDPVAKRWDAPLDKKTIEEMCNWTKKGCGTAELISTINTSLLEAAFHGEEYYNDYADRLRRATLEVLDYVPIVNYRNALSSVRGLDLCY